MSKVKVKCTFQTKLQYICIKYTESNLFASKHLLSKLLESLKSCIENRCYNQTESILECKASECRSNMWLILHTVQLRVHRTSTLYWPVMSPQYPPIITLSVLSAQMFQLCHGSFIQGINISSILLVNTPNVAKAVCKNFPIRSYMTF